MVSVAKRPQPPSRFSRLVSNYCNLAVFPKPVVVADICTHLNTVLAVANLVRQGGGAAGIYLPPCQIRFIGLCNKALKSKASGAFKLKVLPHTAEWEGA